MRRPPPWLVTSVTLGLLLWLAVVAIRYQRVETVQPLLTVIKVVGWLTIFTLACLGAGRLVYRWTGIGKIGSFESLAVSSISGAAVLMAAAAVASAGGVLLPPVLIAILAVATASGVHWVASVWNPGHVRVPAGVLLPCALLLLAVLSTLPILAVLSPFYDQFNYHLAFPYQWLRHGSVFVYPRHSYSYLTANMGLLYCYGMAIAGPWTGQAVYWWMGAVTTLGTWTLGARLGGPRAGAWAAAIFATTPTVLVPSTWASSDLGVAAFAVAGWLILLGRRGAGAPERPVSWLAAGAMAGLAAGCKYLAIAMVAVPLGVAVLLLQRNSPRRVLLHRTGLWLAGAAIAFSPWLIRNAVITGNPVFPVFNRLLQPRVVLASQGSDEVEAAARVAQFPSDRLAPSDRITLGTFNPQGAVGAIGPVFLALAPLALWVAIRRRRRGSALLATGVVLGIGGWWFAPQLGRYLAPVLAVLAALIATGWVMLLQRWSPLVRRCLTGLLAVALLWNLQAVSVHGLDRFACLLHRISEERMLRESVSYWPAIEFVNERLPLDATVLLVAESRTLFLDRRLLVEDPFRTPLVVQVANRVRDESEIVQQLRARGVTHVLFNREESQRIAAMNHRSKYFEPDAPAGAESLQRFFEHSLQPVFAEGAVTVFALGR